MTNNLRTKIRKLSVVSFKMFTVPDKKSADGPKPKRVVQNKRRRTGNHGTYTHSVCCPRERKSMDASERAMDKHRTEDTSNNYQLQTMQFYIIDSEKGHARAM
jgi:hypothetical protein